MHIHVLASLVVVTLCVQHGFSFLMPNPRVKTQYGEVEGVESYSGGEYHAYYGIPFGKTTAAENRWTSEAPFGNWSGVYDATYYRPYCPQLITPIYKYIGLNSVASEECLFLNIYIPQGVKPGTKLPVLYWIYGGAYIVGISDMYPGENLAVKGQVIVVTINYRIATLGFVSTGDSAAEGNYGLWDQVLGLKWVNENIEAFGGDKDRITIMGQSAGGASVSHLSLSPLTKGLFQRVIAVSGVANAYFAYTHDIDRSTAELSEEMFCDNNDTSKVIECLKKVDYTELDLVGVAATFILGKQLPNWVPRVDGNLVSIDPRLAVEKGMSADIDLLLGTCKDDGAFLTYMNTLGLPQGDILNIAKYPGVLHAMLSILFSPYENGHNLTNMILEQYPGMVHEADITNRSKAVTEMLTDFLFLSPATLEGDAHSAHAQKANRSTYMYEFAYRQSFLKYEAWITSVHMDDIYSIFGPPYMKFFRELILMHPLGFSTTDQEVSTMIQSYYANFIYTGNPNEGPHKTGTQWHQYNATSRSYMKFQAQSDAANAELLERSPDVLKRIKFWNETFYKTRIPRTSQTQLNSAHIRASRELLGALENSLEEIKQHMQNKQYMNILQVMKRLFQYSRVNQSVNNENETIRL